MVIIVGNPRLFNEFFERFITIGELGDDGKAINGIKIVVVWCFQKENPSRDSFILSPLLYLHTLEIRHSQHH